MSKRLGSQPAALVVVDFQERFSSAVENFDIAAERASILARAAGLLGIKTIVTEQYPEGLGSTVEPVLGAIGDTPRLPKKIFPATRAEGFDLEGARDVIVCGVEAHVCVLQTVLDLIDDGAQVFVPVDAVASRNELDRAVAIDRMSHAGAVITTTESVVFELAGGSGHPAFRELQGLVK